MGIRITPKKSATVNGLIKETSKQDAKQEALKEESGKIEVKTLEPLRGQSMLCKILFVLSWSLIIGLLFLVIKLS